MSNYSKFQVAGLEWADEIDEELKEKMGDIGLIEIIPDNFFNEHNKAQKATLQSIADHNIPTIIHSVNLSILTIEDFKKDYFQKILNVANKLPNVISFSDHLCMTEVAGMDVGQLTTAPFNDETFQVAKDKINAIQDLTNVPFAIENITHPFLIPNQQYEETEFINKLIKETGCKLLIDVNNIYTNAVNFGVDPIAYISRLPLDQIDSVHLAGGFFDEDNVLQDGHCEAVPQAVWDLFEHLITEAKRPLASIVERTGNNRDGGLAAVLDDVYKAQAIMDKVISKQNIQPNLQAEL